MGFQLGHSSDSISERRRCLLEPKGASGWFLRSGQFDVKFWTDAPSANHGRGGTQRVNSIIQRTRRHHKH